MKRAINWEAIVFAISPEWREDMCRLLEGRRTSHAFRRKFDSDTVLQRQFAQILRRLDDELNTLWPVATDDEISDFVHER